MKRNGIVAGIAGLLMGTALLGCQSPMAPQTDSLSDAGKVNPPSLHVGQWVGAEGGSLNMGVYSLAVPANAVSQRTYIEMEQIEAGNWPVELSPHGIQFDIPVTLSMNAQGQSGAESMGIHWWNPQTQAWELQESVVENGVVSAQLAHFSRYSLF